MSLLRDVRMRVEALAPFRGDNQKIEVTGPEGTVRCEISAVDSLGVALRSLHIEPAAKLIDAKLTLKARTEKLCGKVSYLLEPLALIELDPMRGQAMIRSKKPRTKEDDIVYYELMANANGSTSIQRVVFNKSAKQRNSIDVVVTPEQFEMLVEDLLFAARSEN